MSSEPLTADPRRSVEDARRSAGAVIAARRRGARVDVDGVALDESVLVGSSRTGALGRAQVCKVARDALKLIKPGRNRIGSRLIIAFGDQDAATV